MIEYYYAKDVSTNTVDSEERSLERIPLTPLNKVCSHYDEALVIGNKIKWDTIYYDPEIAKKIPEFASIAQKYNLRTISTSQKDLPSPIAWTKEKELEKRHKLELDT